MSWRGDASARSRGALDLAPRLREVTGARVVAGNVCGPIPVSFVPFGSASLYGGFEGILRRTPRPCSASWMA